MSQMIIEEEILIFVGGVRKIIISVIFRFYVKCIDCFVKKNCVLFRKCRG